MKILRRLLKANDEILLTLLSFGVGIIILIGEGFSTRLGDWVSLTKGASFYLGGVLILCGFWFLYFAIKKIL